MCDMIRVKGVEIKPGDKFEATKFDWSWGKRKVNGSMLDKGKYKAFKDWRTYRMPVEEFHVPEFEGKDLKNVDQDGWYVLPEGRSIKVIFTIKKKATEGKKGLIEFLVPMYPTSNYPTTISCLVKSLPKMPSLAEPKVFTGNSDGFDLVIATSTRNYRGPGEVIDCTYTVKSIFAPQWDMVDGIKNGTMTEEQYTERYHALMMSSYRAHKELWLKAINSKHIVLVCYCKPGQFCHRTILAGYLRQVAEKQGMKVLVKGEV